MSPSLKHPAIESDGITVYVEKVTGAGDLASGTDEGYLQAATLLLLHRAGTG